MDYEKLFVQEEKNVQPEEGMVVSSLAEKITSSAEQDFLHMNAEQEDREKERKDIAKKMTEYKVQLRNHRNIKNHRSTEHNKKHAEKRKEIKMHIAALEMRLQEIADEEKGSKVTGEQIIKNTKTGDDFTNMVLNNMSKPF